MKSKTILIQFERSSDNQHIDITYRSIDSINIAISKSTSKVIGFIIYFPATSEELYSLGNYQTNIVLTIDSVVYDKPFAINHNIQNHLKFINCEFTEFSIKENCGRNTNLVFDSCSIDNLRNYKYHSSVSIEMMNSCKVGCVILSELDLRLTIVDSEMEDNWKFTGCNISSFNITSLIGNASITFYSGTIGLISINRVNINRIYLVNVNVTNTIEISNLSATTQINIERSRISQLKLDLISFDFGLIKISLCEISDGGKILSNSGTENESVLSIDQCNFNGNVEVTNVNHTKLHIKNSIFKDLVVFTVKEPQNLIIDNTSFQNGILIPLDKTSNNKTHSSVWCVLKNQALQSNDKIKALTYRKLEMDSYTKELMEKEDKIPEKVVLYLNKYSNNHGLSWERGVLFSFIVLVAFYTLFVFSVSGFYIDYQVVNLVWFTQSFWEGAISFLWLPSGLKELEDFEGKLSWASFITATLSFLLGKILIAYGIYQTVAAFRKHGKI